MIEWRYVKPLMDENIISNVEKELGISFSDFYISFVKKYNGSRPPISVFDTDKTKERTIKTFLSFNSSDLENITKVNNYLKENDYQEEITKNIVAFADDNFGNYICFNKSNNSIVFFEHETESIEFVANSFDDFFKLVNNK
jgi:hypothetical protein